MSVPAVIGQPTVITYQGRVTSSGNPFNGAGQFKFALVTSTNILSGGMTEADQLLMTNAAGRFEFTDGTLSVRQSTVLNGQLFRVGNGVSPATLNLAGNGFHDFSGVLAISVSANATVRGNGTLRGGLVVLNGGTLSSLSLPALDAGLSWNNRLQVDGSIEVAFGEIIQTNAAVRVMAANLSSGNNQRYETPGLNIFQVLRPDIVAIQEFSVSNSFGINTAAALSNMVATMFGPEFRFFRETNAGYTRTASSAAIRSSPTVRGSTATPASTTAEVPAPRRSFTAPSLMRTANSTATWPVTIYGCEQSPHSTLRPTSRPPRDSPARRAFSTTGRSGNTAGPAVPAASARSTSTCATSSSSRSLPSSSPLRLRR